MIVGQSIFHILPYEMQNCQMLATDILGQLLQRFPGPVLCPVILCCIRMLPMSEWWWAETVLEFYCSSGVNNAGTASRFTSIDRPVICGP